MIFGTCITPQVSPEGSPPRSISDQITIILVKCLFLNEFSKYKILLEAATDLSFHSIKYVNSEQDYDPCMVTYSSINYAIQL